MKLKWIWIAVLIGAIIFGFGFVGSNSAESLTKTEPASSQLDEFHTITLITGDKVVVHETSDGLQTLDITPAERNGYEPNFEKTERGKDIYVIPDDISPHIHNKVDRELFNISKLIKNGYGDEHMNEIPLIISFKNSTSIATIFNTLSTALADQHQFSNLNMMSTKLKKDQAKNFSTFLFDIKGDYLQTNNLFNNNIQKIHLDRRMKASLKDSVPQIGTPEAWEAGYDGDGVKIAVLDSGIDSEHNDLTGKIVVDENFSGDNTSSDLNGHGTHVASIIAGSGSASDGIQKGVAPGASLLNGKVLDVNGEGLESDILKGMEWAADQGADIINMSLGSAFPTDGMDPVSQAINSITESKEVLFVVAAGNLGSEEMTISSPGSADSALTVGAVDRSDNIASFSSRGPRLGDYAIKPDITAPGVEITAARANGTSMGTPVNQHYTSASGTSMASPHIAGAAALLINKWNEEVEVWSPQKIKSHLISTAEPNEDNTIYEQGGGRVDIARAIDQEVYTDSSPLDFGFMAEEENPDPITKEVIYHNKSEDEVTLNFSLDSWNNSIPENMIKISDSSITIKAGNTINIQITIDPSIGQPGSYGGYIKAQSMDGEVTLHTPVGFYKERKIHNITIKGIAQNGNTALFPSSVDIVNVENSNVYYNRPFFSSSGNGTMNLQIPEGTYSVMGMIYSYEDPDQIRTEASLVGEPEITINKDMTITLDARTANEISVDLDDETNLQQFRMAYHREAEEGASDIVKTFTFNPEGLKVFASPTEQTNIGKFEFYTNWQLASPNNHEGKPYLYNLVIPESNIPSNLHYDVEKENLAKVNNKYYGHPPSNLYTVYQNKWRPYEQVSLTTNYTLEVPVDQTVYYFPGDTLYKTSVGPDSSNRYFRFGEPYQSYRVGENLEKTWLEQPLHPGILLGNPPYQEHQPVLIEGDEIKVNIPEYLDANNHWAYDNQSGNSSFRIYQNNNLVIDTARPVGTFSLNPDPGISKYRLELETNWESKEWTPYSSRTYTNLIFHSQQPDDDQQQIVSLLTLDYDLDLQLDNTASLSVNAEGDIPLSFQVGHQPGAKEYPIEGAKVWVSYTDGENWEEIEDVQITEDGNLTANMIDLKDNRDGSGYVSLKVEAWDQEQNSIEQEIIRAYKWNFDGDINGNDMIDIHDVVRAVAHYGTDNEDADINRDGVVDEEDMRILEKNFMKVGPDAGETANPLEKLGSKGIEDFLRSVGLEPMS